MFCRGRYPLTLSARALLPHRYMPILHGIYLHGIHRTYVTPFCESQRLVENVAVAYVYSDPRML